MTRGNITSPKRKKTMSSKARIPRGSKEAKEWNLKMQEARRRKKAMRERAEKRNKTKSPLKTSPKKKGSILVKKKKKSSGKRVRFRKKLEQPPYTYSTVGRNTIARK